MIVFAEICIFSGLLRASQWRAMRVKNITSLRGSVPCIFANIGALRATPLHRTSLYQSDALNITVNISQSALLLRMARKVLLLFPLLQSMRAVISAEPPVVR